MGLDAPAGQQPGQQMVVDPAQPAHAHLLPKLMHHPHTGQGPAQAAEPPPARLLGQLADDLIERVRGRQHGQQVHAPELGRTQGAAPAAGASAREKLRDERVRDIGRQLLQESNRAGRG